MTRLAKLPEWCVHLDALITARVRSPFAWGAQDCVLFAADAVLAMTGVDLAADVRGYTGVRQALRLLRARGGLHAVVDRALGPALGGAYACHGDVVMVSMCGREALGVAINQTQIAGPGAAGLELLPLHEAMCAWRVG